MPEPAPPPPAPSPPRPPPVLGVRRASLTCRIGGELLRLNVGMRHAPRLRSPPRSASPERTPAGQIPQADVTAIEEGRRGA